MGTTAALDRIKMAIADAALANRDALTVSYHDLCVLMALGEIAIKHEPGLLGDSSGAPQEAG